VENQWWAMCVPDRRLQNEESVGVHI
jgi:hypothetical protein